jgi:Ca-activated chloride channel homolog
MELGLSGSAWWIWAAAWLLVPLLIGLLVWGHRKRRTDGAAFGRTQTLYRLFPESMWKTETDARQARFGNQAQVAKTVRKSLRRRRNVKGILLCMGLVFLIAAMGKPRWGSRQESVFKQGIDIVLAVDTSLSMKAQDIAPNRLDKARSEISALLSLLENNRVGLVGFASTTRLHCPLTLDFRGLRSILDQSLSWGKGTNLEIAVKAALRVLERSDVPSKAIVLFSDGEGHEGDLETIVQLAKTADVKIFCVGVGTIEGGPIPDIGQQDSAGYKKVNGEIVWTKLVESDLMRIAQETGGEYVRASGTELEAAQLANKIQAMEKTKFSQTVTTRKEEQFGYFILMAILLLAVEAGLGEFTRVNWELDNE